MLKFRQGVVTLCSYVPESLIHQSCGSLETWLLTSNRVMGRKYFSVLFWPCIPGVLPAFVHSVPTAHGKEQIQEGTQKKFLPFSGIGRWGHKWLCWFCRGCVPYACMPVSRSADLLCGPYPNQPLRADLWTLNTSATNMSAPWRQRCYIFHPVLCPPCLEWCWAWGRCSEVFVAWT